MAARAKSMQTARPGQIPADAGHRSPQAADIVHAALVQERTHRSRSLNKEGRRGVTAAREEREITLEPANDIQVLHIGTAHQHPVAVPARCRALHARVLLNGLKAHLDTPNDTNHSDPNVLHL